jgi:hypothetical protein
MGKLDDLSGIRWLHCAGIEISVMECKEQTLIFIHTAGNTIRQLFEHVVTPILR